TIHTVEEAEGVHFLTMELVEGQPLDHLIPEGGLPIERIIEIAGALADALSAAHEKGIMHRDLKPANVMVANDGRVKVLDFGLAKETRTEANENTRSLAGQTQAGVVMGTPAYMSPEQVVGGELDHRTDIFSLGVILHEMATGQRPFAGQSSAELTSSILRDAPPLVTDVRADLPADLARIIRRCLEKDPRHRVQTARDVANEFRYLARQPSASATAPAPAAARAGAGDASSGSVRAEEGLRIAVLPFKCSGDAEMASFGVGLGEDITTGLSRFRYLSVAASASSARLREEGGDERALGNKLGARYVLEGSLRRGGSAIRVSAQLIDTQTGAQLWAETYNRDLQASSIFAAQDDVAARIVATVADSYGVLVHSMRSAMRQKADADLTPGEWQFQYFAYREQITPGSHAELKSRLERVLERNDRQSDLWACLAQIYVDEYAFGFHGDATSLDRALTAARRAVEFDRANQFALVALAQVHFFRRDLAAFGPAAERAMALNPLNTDAAGILGLQIVHAGEFERGTAIVRRAMELNANHTGWMHFAPLWDHFHRGEYEQALECANRVDVPGLFWPYLVVASACGHLGRRAEAEAAVRDLLALDPEFAAHARTNVESWHFASGLLEPILEGLRKAGLAIPASEEPPSSPRGGGTATAKADGAEPGTDSGQLRAEEGFWVAVLPFKYSGASGELTALAEGMSEEIVTGLSRFSYLRVIARSSTARYAQQAVDVRAAAKELGARYVMEGTLRQAGAKLRIAVQLVDAATGAHLWAETYARDFSSESVFELQDDLVPRIVSTVADMNGVLPRSMSGALRSRAPEQLSPYEAVLRSFGYPELGTPEELAAARAGLNEAVKKAPEHADAWAMLSFLCVQDWLHAFNLQADAFAVGAAAARRAVEAGPSNHLAYYSLAQVLYFQKEFQSFRDAAERAVALNPMDGNSVAFLGELLTYIGDRERGMELAGRAKQLNPNHPGWYWFADFYDAFNRGDYRSALDFALKVRLRGHPLACMMIATASGHLGEGETAAKAVGEFLTTRPDLPAVMRNQVAKVWNAEYGERFNEGLRKAGVEIPPAGAGEAAGPAVKVAAETPAGAKSKEESQALWVAVLPFRSPSGDGELESLAEGLTEEVTSGLSSFSYLQVVSHNSAMAYRGRTADVRTVGRELGARYVLEGSIRRGGQALRVNVQLVDAASGGQLWAETYNRELGARGPFEIQDDLTDRIVATVADGYGVLVRSMASAVREKAVEEASAAELVLRYFAYMQQISPEEHAALREGLERAVEREPGHANAWACLAFLYCTEYLDRFNAREKPMERAREAAMRAVKLDPASQMGWEQVAVAHFFVRDFGAFRPAAERAMSLNPRNGSTCAMMALLLAYAGEWERGVALTEKIMALNPHHPGWYYSTAYMDHYRKREYEAALRVAKKMNMPEFHWSHLQVAAACGQLGRKEEARAAIEALRKHSPTFLDVNTCREDIAKWLEDGELVERLAEGWRKAGLGPAGN
ncbi:MAG TPA: protein kinase, partial [Candidatus Acidoferrales bacterium]|nr:protein kinase [Candidatus Acidoferrales bacterium]